MLGGEYRHNRLVHGFAKVARRTGYRVHVGEDLVEHIVAGHRYFRQIGRGEFCLQLSLG